MTRPENRISQVSDLSDGDYLGIGMGLGVQLDTDGLVSALLHHGQRYPLIERVEDSYPRTVRPLYSERLLDVGPSQIALPPRLKYRCQGDTASRSISINLTDNQVSLDYDRSPAGGILLFADGADSRWTVDPERPDEWRTILRSSDRVRRLGVIISATGGQSPVDVSASGGQLAISSQSGDRLALQMTVRPVPIFESAFVIAGTAEMGAILSSCFHDADRYLPLIQVSGESVDTRRQFSLDVLRRLTGATHYIFAGVAPAVVRDLLWDKPKEFRDASQVFQTFDDVLRDPVYGRYPILRCPRRALPPALVTARRRGCLLAIDEEAPWDLDDPAPMGAVVSYEDETFGAIVAANFAYFHDARLIRAKTVTPEDVALVGTAIEDLQDVVVNRPEKEVTPLVQQIGALVRTMTDLDLTGATSLTAFTIGLPYSAGYDLPVGHIPDEEAAECVLRELTRADTATSTLPIALLVDTEDFTESEIRASLQLVSDTMLATVLAGSHATKWKMLQMMLLLPLSLQVIVAHGAPERFFSEVWEAVGPQGRFPVTVENSSREVPNIVKLGLSEDVRLLRRLSRVETGRSPYVNGILLHDSLFTARDLTTFNVPVLAGLVLNNSCASWKSLASAFTSWGAQGYVGTLWPVAHVSALAVGSSILANYHRVPFAALLHSSVAHLPPVDRSNYVLVGSAFLSSNSEALRIPTATRLFLMLAALESQFQTVAGSLDSTLLELFLPTVRELRETLHGALTEIDPSYHPFLLRMEAAFQEVLRQRGREDDPTELYEAAIGGVSEIIERYRSREDIDAYSETEIKQLATYSAESQLRMLDLYLQARDFVRAEAVITSLQNLAVVSGEAASSYGIRGRIVLAEALRQPDEVARLLGEAVDSGLFEPEAARVLIARYSEPTSAATLLELEQPSLDNLRRRGGSLVVAADSLFREAERLRDTGSIVEAFRCYQRCLEIYRAEDRPLKMAKVHNNLGILYRIAGEDERAKQEFERALTLKSRSRDSQLGHTLIHLADLQVGEPSLALELYSRALAAHEADRDLGGMAEVLLRRAVLLEKLGEFDQALVAVKDSHDAAVKSRHWVVIGQSAVRLGILQTRLGAFDEGTASLYEGLSTLKRLGVLVEEMEDGMTMASFLSRIGGIPDGASVYEDESPVAPHREDPGRSPGANQLARELAGVPSDLPKLYEAVTGLVGSDAARALLGMAIRLHLSRGSSRVAQRLVMVDPSSVDSETRLQIDLALGNTEGSFGAMTARLASEDGATDGERYAADVRRLGNAEKEAKRAEEAVLHLREALDSYRALGDEDTAVAVLVELGNALIEADSFQEAQRCFMEALDYYGASAERFVMLGRTYNSLGYLMQRWGQTEQAFDCYRKCVELIGDCGDPIRVLAHLNMAELAAATGDLHRAASEFSTVVALTDRDINEVTGPELRWRAGAAFNLAQIMAITSRWAQALELCNVAMSTALRRGDLELVKVFARQMYQLASSQEDEGNPSRAESVCLCLRLASERAASGSPYSPHYVECAVYFQSGLWDALVSSIGTIRDVGHPEDALSMCGAVLRLEPRNLRAHIGRGLCLDAMNKPDLADMEYRTCIALDPEHPIAWNNLAVNALRRSDLRVAIEFAERAIGLADGYPNPWEVKGNAHLRLGELSEGKAAFGRYLELVSPSPKTNAIRKLLLRLELGEAAQHGYDLLGRGAE